MALTTEDVAYLCALVEKAPSNYPRRKQIIDILQDAWHNSAARGGEPWRTPITGTLDVMAVSLRTGYTSMGEDS